MHPELLTIPPFGPFHEPLVLSSYGVMIALGFILATQMIGREARRMGEDSPDRFVDLAFYLLLTGLLGSRINFMIVNWRHYAQGHPQEIFYLWRGGLVFYGGYFLATLYAWVWCRRQRVGFFKVADLMIPMVFFNLALGRLGCLAAGCCHGAPSDVPWALHFPMGSNVYAAQLAQGLIRDNSAPLAVHPTQIYEALGALALFFVLTWLRARKQYHGQLLVIGLVGYAGVRSGVELFRGDFERGFPLARLSYGQLSSLASVVVAGILYVALQRRQRALQRHSSKLIT